MRPVRVLFVERAEEATNLPDTLRTLMSKHDFSAAEFACRRARGSSDSGKPSLALA